ncbi:hypothetical protein Bca52824_019463 [Brassica carinata]|uniref:HTH myb-type domain-containing protein n=1 Tax=Brassica carinata TaxID=52824 RepID=A0A8X7VRV6_BRACI|nr:hypothetical protein Bca52824_019463 [Brassica carinata]
MRHFSASSSLLCLNTHLKMGRPPCCEKSNVKKGLWTEEEDAKILAYVEIHSWNTKLKKRLMRMEIYPVAHKPVSQVLSEFRNISGHGESSETSKQNHLTTQAWENDQEHNKP